MAEAGDAAAMATLGEWRLQGNPVAGVEQDIPAAVNHFQQAAAAGDPYGKYFLGVLHQQGGTGLNNLTRAKELLLEAGEVCVLIVAWHGAMASWLALATLEQPLSDCGPFLPAAALPVSRSCGTRRLV